MSLGQLIGSIQSAPSLYQGLLNYAGNNTGFGKAINGLDNIYQSATGQPKQQLIGQPAKYTNPTFSSNHLGEADANGIRPFTDAGVEHINNNIPDNSSFLLPKAPPTNNNNQNNQAPALQPLQGSGAGKAIAALALL